MLPIDAVAFELWTISNDIAFDNVIVTNSVEVANYISDSTYQIKKDLMDAETDSWFIKLIKYTNKNPWLWVIYLILFAIPLVLFIGYCCVSHGKGSQDEAKEMAEDLLSREQSAKYGISGDKPSPIDEEELSKLSEEQETSRDYVSDENNFEGAADDFDEELDESELIENVDKDEKVEEEEEETKPRQRKTRARKDN
ncbi:calnexin-like protein [Leptotrombidium deliense]|uniref:Calnexin-like protein n=1 Tax=Leptotrombidium deliense TaxID=299467 RepID=A0A443S1W6_9ACAR|nr:calnexin-like protein [Leptotrombidium deliense]